MRSAERAATQDEQSAQASAIPDWTRSQLRRTLASINGDVDLLDGRLRISNAEKLELASGRQPA